MKAFEKLSQVFSDVANRKHRAAQTRAKGISPTAEPSRDVYLESCSRIASAFVPDGFSYAKSGPHMTRSDSTFKYTVAFQSSRHNIPGEHVALWMAASVRCPSLLRWRKLQAHPSRTDDWVAGGMVHLLSKRHKWLQWDLANSGTREAVIADGINFVRNEVLPYFQLFRNPSELVGSLANQDIPELGLSSAVEFALCNNRLDIAKAVLDHFEDTHPDLASAISSEYERILQQGFPSRRDTRYAKEVAWLRAAYRLD